MQRVLSYILIIRRKIKAVGIKRRSLCFDSQKREQLFRRGFKTIHAYTPVRLSAKHGYITRKVILTDYFL